MGLERPSAAAVGRVEAEGDGFGVLVRRVEGVAQVHEECVAAPPEAVLDIRIREPGAVEEVGGGDANGVAGPCVQVFVPLGDVEYLLRNMAQEDRDLRGRDEAALAGVGILVHRGGAVGRQTKAPRSPDDVQAGLRGAQPV